ncbi:Uncharacterised protein [Vibrio cholerae]|uniref:Uncharacterized protein n=1 Tax=Vibrio cholerae TaxID=666 RepID=A0A656AGQ0_VIBCL|nr:Uncharacterised protein [Vibrio cholerae]CSD09416.1 Uncharacterised protein [Vibrio cholerae]
MITAQHGLFFTRCRWQGFYHARHHGDHYGNGKE